MRKFIDRIRRRFGKKRKTGKITFEVDAVPVLLDEYQKFAVSTADDCAQNPLYLAVGLCEEAGEVAGKVKKVVRDHHGFFTVDREKAVALELGDVLWYLANMAHKVGFSLSEIAALNEIKVRERIKFDTLHGEGDER